MTSVLNDKTEFTFKGGKKNTLISREIELFGIINLNIYIALKKTLYKGNYNILLNVAFLRWEI